jgi:hypothetical protein
MLSALRSEKVSTVERNEEQDFKGETYEILKLFDTRYVWMLGEKTIVRTDDFIRRHLVMRDQMGDARGNHVRLARAWTG